MASFLRIGAVGLLVCGCLATGMTPYYEDPKSGCRKDEKVVRVPGANGTLCSPVCKSRACPTKVPDAVTGKPHCVLKVGATRRCALLCNKYSNCGKNASCKLVRGAIGMCTYDDDAVVDGAEVAVEADASE